jgi:Na+/H+ antiporter NhaA
MKHPVDTAVIFGALWLLAAMAIDALTPTELTVYMIGAALAPAVSIGALFYHLRLPRTDLTITLAVLWLVAVMAMEWITPKPLSAYFMTAAVAPSILVGGWLHGATAWRRRTRSSQRKRA